jgi:hypothetical protein
MSSKLKIQRNSRYADKIRDYSIILDGKTIGRISDGDTKILDIKPGAHTLRLTISWCRSNRIRFDARSDETIAFKCANSMEGVKLLLGILYITVLFQKYIKLERLD